MVAKLAQVTRPGGQAALANWTRAGFIGPDARDAREARPCPRTPTGTAALFRATYGPTVHTFEALDEDGRASFAAELAAHWTTHRQAGAAGTAVESEYLEVVAVRR